MVERSADDWVNYLWRGKNQKGRKELLILFFFVVSLSFVFDDVSRKCYILYVCYVDVCVCVCAYNADVNCRALVAENKS